MLRRWANLCLRIWIYGGLLHYIGLLDERQGRVLQLYYFESYVWTDVAKAMHMTVRTAQRIRQQAVDELEKLYAFAKDFFLI